MEIALWLLVGAAALHVLEEFLWPGGFLDHLRAIVPSAVRQAATPTVACVVNGLMFVVLIGAAYIGDAIVALSLSGAALTFINGCVHITGSVRSRAYVPGVVSGSVLYLPLSTTAFTLAARAGDLTPARAALAVLLGLGLQAAPAAWFGFQYLRLWRRRQASPQ